MVFQCIDIRQVPWEVLKTAAFGRGFQHFPRDLANVDAWKTMFDPYIDSLSHNVRKLTFGYLRPAKIQISLHIRTVWSESLQQRLWSDCADMYAVWIFVGRTCQKTRSQPLCVWNNIPAYQYHMHMIWYYVSYYCCLLLTMYPHRRTLLIFYTLDSQYDVFNSGKKHNTLFTLNT